VQKAPLTAAALQQTRDQLLQVLLLVHVASQHQQQHRQGCLEWHQQLECLQARHQHSSQVQLLQTVLPPPQPPPPPLLLLLLLASWPG